MNIFNLLFAPLSNASMQSFLDFMSGGAFIVPLAVLGLALALDASWRIYLFIASTSLCMSAFYPSPEGKALTLLVSVLVIAGVFAYRHHQRRIEEASIPEHMRRLDWDALDRKLLN